MICHGQKSLVNCMHSILPRCMSLLCVCADPGSCDPAQNQKVCSRVCCCWVTAMNSAKRWSLQLGQVSGTVITELLGWNWFVSEWLRVKQVGLFHTHQQNAMPTYLGFMEKLAGRAAWLNSIALYCIFCCDFIFIPYSLCSVTLASCV